MKIIDVIRKMETDALAREREEKRLIAYKPSPQATTAQKRKEELQGVREQTASIRAELDFERQMETERKHLVQALRQRRRENPTLEERERQAAWREQANIEFQSQYPAIHPPANNAELEGELVRPQDRKILFWKPRTCK